MKNLILLAVFLACVGCMKQPEYKVEPMHTEEIRSDEKANTEKAIAEGKRIAAMSKEEYAAYLQSKKVEDDENKQEIKDYINGTGKHANDKLIDAINEQTRQTNNNLLWMRIEQQRLINNLYHR